MATAAPRGYDDAKVRRLSMDVMEFWFRCSDDDCEEEATEMKKKGKKMGNESGGDSGGDTHARLRRMRWFVPPGEERDALDEKIKSVFKESLEALEVHVENTDLRSSPWLQWPHAALAATIILDQFSRHIYRGDLQRIRQSTQRAAKAAQCALDMGYDKMMPLSHACFLYMPLRHLHQCTGNDASTFNLGELRALSDRCTAREMEAESHAKTLKRFSEATRSSISKGIALTKGSGDSTSFSEDDILERTAFTPDNDLESKVNSNALYRAIVAFLRSRITFNRNAPKRVPVAISLSGGVDSMVVAKLLWYINERKHLLPAKGLLDIYAVHIDYGNRLESAAEAAFLRKWCSAHSIDLRVKRIDEVRRGVTARDDYEKIARKIRFGEYKRLLAELGSNGMTSMASLGIMFAHHRGDVQENVISNVMRGAGIISLSGMGPDTINDGVKIWRPLLGFDKKPIYAFAHAYGVPYFKDTTPDWSTRGKLRNKLLPCLEEVYGSGYLPQLTSLAQQSDDVALMVNAKMINPFFKDCVQTTPLGVLVNATNYADHSLFFWRLVLRKICHEHIHCSDIASKAAGSFHKTMRSAPKQTTRFFKWIEMKRDHRACLFTCDAALHFMFFRAHALPATGKSSATPSEMPPKDGTIVCRKGMFPTSNTFGRWRISISLPAEGASEDDGNFSMISFFQSGCCKYALPIRDADYIVDGPSASTMPFFDREYKKFVKPLPLVVPSCDVCRAPRAKRRKAQTEARLPSPSSYVVVRVAYQSST